MRKTPILFVTAGLLLAMGTLFWHLKVLGFPNLSFFALTGTSILLYLNKDKYTDLTLSKRIILWSGFLLILITAIFWTGIYIVGSLTWLLYIFGISMTLFSFNINFIKMKLSYIFPNLILSLLPSIYIMSIIYLTSYLSRGPNSIWERYESIFTIIPILLVLLNIFVTTLLLNKDNRINRNERTKVPYT